MNVNKTIAIFVFILVAFGGINVAVAGDYCVTVKECKAIVKAEVAAQIDSTDGRLWGPPSVSACEIASREQEGNERRCRKYDKKPGGKTIEECAKCYRQVVLDLARWQQCYKGGWAPPVPDAMYRSLAKLGASASQ